MHFKENDKFKLNIIVSCEPFILNPTGQKKLNRTVNSLLFTYFLSSILNWSIRPNLEGRIVRKPEGQIFNHKAEMIINRMAEFDRKAE